MLGNSSTEDFEGEWSGDVYYTESWGATRYIWREHVESPGRVYAEHDGGV